MQGLNKLLINLYSIIMQVFKETKYNDKIEFYLEYPSLCDSYTNSTFLTIKTPISLTTLRLLGSIDL
jgi:hypothetical protein